VHLTRTGKGLLDSLKDGDCDAVILDSDVSDMAYTQVGSILLRQYPDLFVLVISPEEDLAILPPANFTPHAFLDRPFYMPDLLTKLDSLFGLGAAYVEPAEKRTPSWVSDPESATNRLQQNLANGPAQGAILFEQGQLIAYAGNLLTEGEANRLVELLLRHWEADARSDLMRYVRPSNRGGEYQLYARTLAGPVVMALVFEYGIPLSQMRSTTQRWARTLEDLTPAGLTTTYPYTLRAQASGEAEAADEPENTPAVEVSVPAPSSEVGPDTILKTVNYFESVKTIDETQSDDLSSDDDMGWIDTVEDEDGAGFDPLNLAELLAEMPSPDPERNAAREELARILAKEWNIVDRDESAQTGAGSGGLAEEPGSERKFSLDNPLNEAASEPEDSGFAGVSPVLDADSPDLSLEELFPDIFSTPQAAAPDLPSTSAAPAAADELPANDITGLDFLLDPGETPAAGDETAPIDGDGKATAPEMGWLTEEGVPVGEAPAVADAGPQAQDASEVSPEVGEGPADPAAEVSMETAADSITETMAALPADGFAAGSAAGSSAEESGLETPGEEADLPESDSVQIETPVDAEIIPDDGARLVSLLRGFTSADETTEQVEEEPSQDRADDFGLPDWLFSAEAEPASDAPEAAAPVTGVPEAEAPEADVSASDVAEPVVSPAATSQEPRPFWFDELISTTPVIPSPAHEAERAKSEEVAASESDDLLLPWEQPNSLDWLEHEADTKPVVLSVPAVSAGKGDAEIPFEPESPVLEPAEEQEASLEAGDQPAPGDDLPTAVDWPLAGDLPEPESGPSPLSADEASIPAWIESPPEDDATRPVALGGRPFVLPFVTDEADLLSPSLAPLAGEPEPAAESADENDTLPMPSDPLTSGALAGLSTELVPPLNGVAYTCILIPRYEDHRLIGDLAGLLESTVPQDCEAFGWYPENVEVKPSYLLWVVQVTSSVSPGNLVRIIRQRTTDRIYQTFPYLHVGSENDFWAPGYLVVHGSQPPDAKNVREFIENTRRRQNGSSS
jgi:putative transposase